MHVDIAAQRLLMYIDKNTCLSDNTIAMHDVSPQKSEERGNRNRTGRGPLALIDLKNRPASKMP
jgi:hypothetical protein